jgi:hypothetical protein
MQQQEYDPGADMTTKSVKHPHYHLARLALLLLVVIPFIPEIVVTATAALGRLKGCLPDQKDACQIGPVAVSDVINWALHAKASWMASETRLENFYLAIAGWMLACYVALTLGWTRVSSRLLLGFAVALVFALLPYFVPILTIADLLNEASCKPTGGGNCRIFGGMVSGIYAAIRMARWDTVFDGALVAFGMYFVYAVVVALAGVVAARRPAKPEQSYS